MYDNKGSKAVNSVQFQDAGQPSSSNGESSSGGSGNDAVFVKIDQLQNQLNQVMMMMMQQCQKDPPTGIVNSHTIRRFKFIASIMTRFKAAWVINTGATDSICITMIIMHDAYFCNPPIHITLPNG